MGRDVDVGEGSAPLLGNAVAEAVGNWIGMNGMTVRFTREADAVAAGERLVSGWVGGLFLEIDQIPRNSKMHAMIIRMIDLYTKRPWPGLVRMRSLA